MNTQEIIEAVNHIMTEEFEIEASLLKPEVLLGEDLSLDSLDGVDLVVALEKTFKIRIPEEDARAMQKLEDIYNYLDQNIK